MQAMAIVVLPRIGDAPNPLEGWGPHMPPWTGRDHSRGLLGVGETRKGTEKGASPIEKKGAIPELCRAPLMETLDEYWRTFGVPPVEAGEPLKKAIKDGRFPADYMPKGRNTRGQTILVPLPLGRQFNLRPPFQLFMAAGYCRKLSPPVEDGTKGQRAVLGFLRQKRIYAQVVKVLAGKLQRLTNNLLVSPCCVHLNAWVRAGVVDEDNIAHRLV